MLAFLESAILETHIKRRQHRQRRDGEVVKDD